MKRYKVNRAGNIYQSKNKEGYTLRNAKMKAKKVKKANEKQRMINKRIKNNLIRQKAKQNKKRIEAKRRRDSNIKRKNWKTQVKNKKKYEKRGDKAVNKARTKRDKSYWLVKK